MAKKKAKVEKFITKSPKPVVKVEMLNFYDAIREVQNKKRLTRVQWDDKDIYIFLNDQHLSIHIGGKDSQLIVSLGDMEGLDWYVLPDQN